MDTGVAPDLHPVRCFREFLRQFLAGEVLAFVQPGAPAITLADIVNNPVYGHSHRRAALACAAAQLVHAHPAFGIHAPRVRI